MNEDTARLIVLGLMGGIALFAMSVLLLKFLRSFLYICEPNQVIVFTGRQTRVAGRQRGYNVLHAGRRIRVPFIEQAQVLDMTAMTVDLRTTNAYSKGNIPLNVHAIANVKIASAEPALDNAIERFLGRERAEIQRVARETIEGSLRGVLARLTPEQVNEDRLKFVQALSADAEDDLARIGLQLDTLKIQSVTDDVNYLNSIGRARIAAALRDAEVAESDNKREADRALADYEARGRVARENASAVIDSRRNNLRRIVAELEAQARSAEERTAAAQGEARARAEVQLQEVRTQLERLRLQADTVLPAEASRVVSELRAQAAAAPISAQGRASAEALDLISGAWTEAGEAATDIFVVQQLEPLLRRVVGQLGDVDLGNINLIDSGDGVALGRLAAAQPAMIAQVLDSVGQAAGINIREILLRDAPVALPGASRATPPAPASRGVAGSQGTLRSTGFGANLPTSSTTAIDADEMARLRAQSSSRAPVASQATPVVSHAAPVASQAAATPASVAAPALAPVTAPQAVPAVVPVPRRNFDDNSNGGRNE